jgi:hypothetical protein
MQLSIITKLSINVTSKLASVLKHNATFTVEGGGKILGSIFFRSRLENRDERPWEFVALTTQHRVPAKFGTNFTGKRRSIGGYRLLAD